MDRFVIMITAFVTCQVTCLARNSRVLVTRAVIGTILGALLSGCVVIPFPTIPNSRPVPDVAPGLPQDLLSSNDEVLVLVQSAASKRESGWDTSHLYGTSATHELDFVNAPVFMRGKELISLNETLKMESSSGYRFVGLCFIICRGGEAGAGVNITQENLQRLCVVAKDGRIMTFLPESLPGEKERFVTYRETLYVNRRDAIISALREDTKYPFGSALREDTKFSLGRVDGPCGIYGEVNWPKKTRSRTIDFLTGIPGNQPAEANKPLAQILRRAKTAADAAGLGAGSGMLLVSTSRYGQTVVEAPMFFSAADFSTFKEAVIALDATQIIPLLPTYSSGMRAFEVTSLELLCAVGSDGRVLWWSKVANAWQGLNGNPPSVKWKEDTLAVLNGLPQADRIQAAAFLDRVEVR